MPCPEGGDALALLPMELRCSRPGRMGGTAGPVPAEQCGAPAGHDAEGQRFPQRSRRPRSAVAAADGRGSSRSDGSPARQRPQHPCGERRPSAAPSGPGPPPFQGHPLLRHGRLPPSLPPAPLPPFTHGPARAPRTAAAAAMSPRPAYGSRRRSGWAAPTDNCKAPRPRWEERGPLRALSKMAGRARDPLLPL